MDNPTIDNSILDALLRAHDGDVALLYLHTLSVGGFDADRAARELCRTMGEINAAKEKLDRLITVPTVTVRPDAPQPPPDELPEYTAEEIRQRTKDSADFAAILAEARNVMGHVLSSAEMKTLFGVYDYLRLPTDVILMLLNYCLEQCVERYGQQRRPTARTIEREAYNWVNREITTYEQADEYIRSRKERQTQNAKIRATLGITGRQPTPTEEKYIASWLDMGFTQEAVAVALDRTVTNVGSLKWGYMDKILRNWDSKGLHTAAQIGTGDPPRRSENSSQTSGTVGRSIDLKGLDELLK